MHSHMPPHRPTLTKSLERSWAQATRGDSMFRPSWPQELIIEPVLLIRISYYKYTPHGAAYTHTAYTHTAWLHHLHLTPQAHPDTVMSPTPRPLSHTTCPRVDGLGIRMEQQTRPRRRGCRAQVPPSTQTRLPFDSRPQTPDAPPGLSCAARPSGAWPARAV